MEEKLKYQHLKLRTPRKRWATTFLELPMGDQRHYSLGQVAEWIGNLIGVV